VRIGLLTDAYKPVLNGVTLSVSLLKKALEDQGHEVFVFTFGYLDYEDDEERVIRSRGIPISDTGYYIGLGLSPQARKLYKTMDVLHAHHPFISGPIAVSCGRRYDIPVVFTSHTRYDIYARYYLPFVPDSLSRLFFKTYFPLFTSRCDLVIAPSRGIYDLLRSFGVKARVEIIHNGIDLEPFLSPPKKAKPDLVEDGKVLIFVGRIAKEKNLRFLLRAFASFKSELGRVHLIFVGGGNEISELKVLSRKLGIGGRVHFIGRVQYEEVPGYLAIADAFVTPSTAEGHPLSVIEALASGLPVLGMDSSGIRETITHGFNGLLATDDLEDFGRKMVRLMTDDALRKKLSEGAKESGRRYSISRTSRRILECYRELIEERRSG
jgi:glycosyltransferase involved in cell wall biosynthesis